MFSNANMRSRNSSERTLSSDRTKTKSKAGKSDHNRQRRSKSTPPSHKVGNVRYKGLEEIRARAEDERKLPVGSKTSDPAVFSRYSSNNSDRIQLDADLHWTDARRAAKCLLLKIPPLTADLNSKQKLGLEHVVTDLLFHVPKFGHEILAGKEGKYGGLDLEARSWFRTEYAAQVAVSSGPAQKQRGDLLRCLQLAKTDFNKWSFEMRDLIKPAERRFPHYLTTGRFQKALEEAAKFDYVDEGFFEHFRFTDTQPVISENNEEDLDDDQAFNNNDEDDDVIRPSPLSNTTEKPESMVEMMKEMLAMQSSLSKRIQKVESKVGVALSPGPPAPKLQSSSRSETTVPKKLDLMSPLPVKIDISTGGSKFKDVTTFRLFEDTYQRYFSEMDGITKNPSSSKKRNSADSDWCLEALACKYSIDSQGSSAPVLKEHVAHMATVTHLFKNYGNELRSGKFKDAGLVPLIKKRKRCDDN